MQAADRKRFHFWLGDRAVVIYKDEDGRLHGSYIEHIAMDMSCFGSMTLPAYVACIPGACLGKNYPRNGAPIDEKR